LGYENEDIVDILHHTAIGFAGALALTAVGEPAAAMMFVIASALPDADVAAIARGKVAYLKAHQTATHSIPFIAGVALGSGLLSSLLISGHDGLMVGLAALVALLLHVALDATNTLGTALLWPWRGRYRLDAIFFIDALSWAMVLTTIAVQMRLGAAWPFFVYLVAMAAQITWRAKLSRRARAEAGFPIAIPDPIWPGRFHLTRPEADGSVSLARWTPRKGLTLEGCIAAPSAHARRIAETSRAFADMSGFARALSIVAEEKVNGLRKVVLRDAAMRPLGRRYGEITLQETPAGSVAEHINI
jgi:membrane-bound metal-dependent hydrolase YbcI (DUF457 family)